MLRHDNFGAATEDSKADLLGRSLAPRRIASGRIPSKFVCKRIKLIHTE